MPRVIYIEPTGPPYAPRWRIVDGDQNYWNERNAWVTDPTEASLYTDYDEAATKLHELMLSQVPGTLSTFAFMVTVEVKGNSVSIPDLHEWLLEHVQVTLAGGLINESMVVLLVEWNTLEEQ
jgi:hypothetical protein